MSKKTFYGKSSQQLQQAYNEVCYKLGQEIGNERRSITNQDVLRKQQEELEDAFNAAIVREQEAQSQKDKAAKATKEFSDKSVGSSDTNTEGPDERTDQLGPVA